MRSKTYHATTEDDEEQDEEDTPDITVTYDDDSYRTADFDDEPQIRPMEIGRAHV